MHLNLMSRLIFTSDEYTLRVGPRETAGGDTSRHLTAKVLSSWTERKQSSVRHNSPRCHVEVRPHPGSENLTCELNTKLKGGRELI